MEYTPYAHQIGYCEKVKIPDAKAKSLKLELAKAKKISFARYKARCKIRRTHYQESPSKAKNPRKENPIIARSCPTIQMYK